jgi:hypothetical protein
MLLVARTVIGRQQVVAALFGLCNPPHVFRQVIKIIGPPGLLFHFSSSRTRVRSSPLYLTLLVIITREILSTKVIINPLCHHRFQMNVKKDYVAKSKKIN